MSAERERIKELRAAFIEGGTAVFDAFKERGILCQHLTSWTGLRALAESRWALPKVTRPRVVADPHAQNVLWKAVNGELSQGLEGLNGRGRDWAKIVALHVPTPPTRARVALWADLIANPTEDVDDDA